ncbi:MAG: hypothetical protein HFE66_03840 [Clostridiales bacterium]|jgi:hypothetical protein|nr:hypothetical protein [Clostridiales bacterium]
MAAQINPPGIHAATTEGQIAQIKSYLLQLARQLQYEFDKLNPIAVENTAEQDLSAAFYDRLYGYMRYERFACTDILAHGATIEAQDCRYYSTLHLCSIRITASATSALDDGVWTSIAQLPARCIPTGPQPIGIAREDCGLCCALVRGDGTIAVSVTSPVSPQAGHIYIAGVYQSK